MHSNESNLLLTDLEYETCATQVSSNMVFQHSGNHQMQLRPHEDLMLKYHKLQQEADHLRDLLAQEEAQSRSLQDEITELRKALHQNKRRLRGERYYQRRRISREMDVRGPKDLWRGDRSYRSEFPNFRRWMDRRCIFMSAPLLNRRPYHRRLYHRGPPDTGWRYRHGHISSNQIWNFSRLRR